MVKRLVQMQVVLLERKANALLYELGDLMDALKHIFSFAELMLSSTHGSKGWLPSLILLQPHIIVPYVACIFKTQV